MKKQKISKPTINNYESNLKDIPDDIDYDDYLREKKEKEFAESLETTGETEKTTPEKKKGARARIAVTEEKARKARENLKDTPLEKNDFKAMVIAAFITMGLPTIVILAIIFGIGYLVFKLMGL